MKALRVGSVVLAALLAVACSADGPRSGAGGTPPPGGAGAGQRTATAGTPTAAGTPGTASSSGHTPHAAPATRQAVALRPGERQVTLRLPRTYTPKAPSTGTDDYRCFLLDPGLEQDSFVTGIDVLPGNPDVVHHVILFRVPPAQLAAARQRDREDAGLGWTCFGGSGLSGAGASLESAPWLGAWAPGGGERVLADDLGIPVAAGSAVVMQVHYNLLEGAAPDRSAARLRVAAAGGQRKALDTVLLPGPVELPCRPGRTGPLCSRPAAVADVTERFGRMSGLTGNYLNMVCQGRGPSATQRCAWPVSEPATIRAAAGHMHLLGRSIRIDVERSGGEVAPVLDIPVWDFDDQGSRPVAAPLRVGPGDRLRVTCTHDQSLRDRLPAFEDQPERYVVWGEGTTDEMCLGIVMVTRP